MLGFGPISSSSISGDGFKLISIPLALAATATITFGLTGRIGATIPMGATVGFAFSGSPTLYVNQAISGTGTIIFGGAPNLRLAGKAIEISAIPMQFTLRATPGSYLLKAIPERFTSRGVR